MVQEILTRLPIIDLYTARCVCTSWRSIVASPEFIQKHRCQNHRPHLGLLVSTANTNTRELQFHYASLHNEDATNPSPFVCRLKLADSEYSGTTQVVNHLACLYSDKRASLINICTREILPLPKPPVHSSSCSHYFLGCNTANNVYKILRQTTNEITEVTKYEILTVTIPVSSCKWREVKFHDEGQDQLISELNSWEDFTNSLCADGTLYWVCSNRFKGVLAFNLSEETFDFSYWPGQEQEQEHLPPWNEWKVLPTRQGLGLVHVSLCREKLEHYSWSETGWVRRTVELPEEFRGNRSSGILPVGILPNGETLLANGNVDDNVAPVYSFDFDSNGFHRFLVGKFSWSEASGITCIQEDLTPLLILLGNGNGSSSD